MLLGKSIFLPHFADTIAKNKNLGTKMKVIDLEKRFEFRGWALLAAFNVILFVGFIYSSSEVSSLLFSFLACAVTLLLALLVFNSKRNLTVCRHGVHYRNLFGQCRHMHARQVQFIHHYSFFQSFCPQLRPFSPILEPTGFAYFFKTTKRLPLHQAITAVIKILLSISPRLVRHV